MAMADEVAQRVADLGDAKIKTRYLDNVSRMLERHLGSRQCPEALRTNPYDRIEWEIFNAMTESVAEATFKNLQKQTPVEVKHEGITHVVYTQKVAAFVEEKGKENREKSKREDKNQEPIRLEEMDMDQINDALDKFIVAFLAQSEEVRESDSRSKYIIRQLYKAYVNDVTLLPDAFLDDHLTRIANGNDFKEALAEKTIPEHGDQASVREISEVFGKIREKAWYVENAVTRGFSKKLFDMNAAKDYFEVLKTNNANGSKGNCKVTVLFDAFLLDVGFYIAGMTNTEAFDAYNRIYGHTP